MTICIIIIIIIIIQWKTPQNAVASWSCGDPMSGCHVIVVIRRGSRSTPRIAWTRARLLFSAVTRTCCGQKERGDVAIRREGRGCGHSDLGHEYDPGPRLRGGGGGAPGGGAGGGGATDRQSLLTDPAPPVSHRGGGCVAAAAGKQTQTLPQEFPLVTSEGGGGAFAFAFAFAFTWLLPEPAAAAAAVCERNSMLGECAAVCNSSN